MAILVYTAQLVKPGRLKFTYQYADDSVLFQFQVNDNFFYKQVFRNSVH